MKKQIRNEIEKKKKEYVDAVLSLSAIDKEMYELELKRSEAKMKEQKARWEYWQAINKALNKK